MDPIEKRDTVLLLLSGMGAGVFAGLLGISLLLFYDYTGPMLATVSLITGLWGLLFLLLIAGVLTFEERKP